MHVEYDLRKLLFFFTNKVVELWNSLQDYAINVDTLDLCKRGLDKFWDNQIVKFDFEADIHGV